MSSHSNIGFDRALKATVLVVFLISGVVNLLTLSGAFYMLQVYDRVLTSHSIETLVALTALVAGLYLVYGLLDVIRSQILIRIAARTDRTLMPRAHSALVTLSALGAAPAEAAQPVRDVDTVRGFLGSPGPVALLDLPWTPIFLGFVWLLSPTLGMVTLLGLGLLVLLAWITHFATRRLEAKASETLIARSHEAEAGIRAAEAAAAMGFLHDASVRFLKANQAHIEVHKRSGDVVGLLAAISKVVRLMLQSGILGLGAYLAIQGDISMGGIVAASLAAARALAPAEQAIASWRGYAAFRESLRRLDRVLASQPAAQTPLPLPPPRESLVVDQATVPAPDTRRIALSSIAFKLTAGQGLAIVGRSGSGKSTLARALIGVWPLAHGAIRLDGAPLGRWSPADRGAFIGYMPQSIELFPGTISDNIARLEHQPSSAMVIEAAKAAGIHDTILQLPDGYETRLGPGGALLSAGQRQQIGLARALYGNPFLVVLDEPNSSLDAEGEDALIAALHAVRKRGGIVVVVAHRRGVLNACDMVAVLQAGRLKSFGAKNDVLETPVTPIHDRLRSVRASASGSAEQVRGVSP